MEITIEIGTIVASMLTAIITLVIAVISGVVSSNVAKKQRTIEIITSNRVEWIGNVKELISEYFLYTHSWSDEKFPMNDTKADKWMEKVSLLTYKISLQLNLKGTKDRYIKKLINNLNNSFIKLTIIGFERMINYNKEKTYSIIEILDEKTINRYISQLPNCEELRLMQFNSELHEKIIDDIIEALLIVEYLPNLIEIYIQIYLKCEWERVKVEARKGINARFNFEKEFNKIEKELECEINDIKKILPKKVYDE